ncbi:MAG TPA: glycine cleavage system aminomethyltransferase GcvT [Oscillatoriaceae cyanobacterium M33_DOE_052]|uniref:Aminomethyltransferase n=1 Tax=Planktothricoides sp. SpSt-374 TaxID=2282167 RepID=A0A7C3VQ35_9CYAN|nr:glycine cleavage system aminomethyltransferase GcvT [Oscillatoriaceae cyanobacterium M33_DOE_052]
MAKSSQPKPETETTLLRTPLYELSATLNARMTPFSGWEMPVQYTGVVEEHTKVRTAAGMFDISHMGKFPLEGENLLEAFQYLVPSDLTTLQPGEAKYTVLLNPSGGIIDDIIFYYQGQSDGIHRGMTIVNAATTAKDWEWLQTHLAGTGVQLQDLSRQKVLIAVQGPQAGEKLQQFVQANLSELRSFGHVETLVFAEPAFIARTGYTGEDGFEVMLDPEVGARLWRELLAAGVTPCGLGARDTLRLEAAMALYGQDIDDTTTPLEAGLGFCVQLEAKGDFIGRQVLAAQKQNGVERRLVGLEMAGRGIPRHGYPVLFEGKTVGEITSGSWSPTLSRAIGLAYVPTHLAKIGQELEVEIRGKLYAALVVKKPFYRSPNRPK